MSLSLGFTLAMVLGCVYLFIRFKNSRVKDYLALKPFTWYQLLQCSALLIVLNVIINLVTVWLGREPMMFMDNLAESAHPRWLLVLAMVVFAQIYKERDDKGFFIGGPAYYFEKALGQKWYAVLFAISAIAACGLLLPGVQANSIAEAMNNSLGVAPSVSAAVIAALLGFIIFGGVKRIASSAELIVPFMALAYIIVAIFRGCWRVVMRYCGLRGCCVQWRMC